MKPSWPSWLSELEFSFNAVKKDSLGIGLTAVTGEPIDGDIRLTLRLEMSVDRSDDAYSSDTALLLRALLEPKIAETGAMSFELKF